MLCVFHCGRNEWGPPERKVDTRKYRAEPKSIFEYEPGKSSILEHERPVSVFKSIFFFILCDKGSLFPVDFNLIFELIITSDVQYYVLSYL